MKEQETSTPRFEIEPIPVCGISRILGLLETLDDRGGRETMGRLAGDLHIEFGQLLAVVKAAEMLGLVSTPGPDVVLEAFGKATMELPMNEKKRTLREKIRKLPLFAAIETLLRRQEDQSLPKDVLLEELVVWLPDENPETLFKTVVNWGRYAELFSYDADEERLAIDQGS
ncbi:MAG: AAA-associated domain-containing protein [Thermoanaerobaculia bacterium]